MEAHQKLDRRRVYLTTDELVQLRSVEAQPLLNTIVRAHFLGLRRTFVEVCSARIIKLIC